MNTYRVEFFARCPVNAARIKYWLCIRTDSVIPAEALNDAVDEIRSGLHEQIADSLLAAFGGQQTLTAEHHGVHIETTRP